ncbi:2-hydroxyacid dehydrogenase [Roseomonas sp. OT10]|uniref:2-hydroxyacid dehydrogenase n=1 Tax=Roseomonas cutis TaxID=2897332 RepID=UPI001E4EB7F1|nr:2-hydroxyacid dehydrogenase [Roseomonas sp. OT10]UFN48373.1 2-hydroxyacid dehydrogenase [Roseomonas sp. OT10]
MSAPEVLILSPYLPEEDVTALRGLFPCHGPFDAAGLDSFLATQGGRVAGIATSGKVVLDAAMLDRMPGLRIISCFSAGTDRIDTDALAQRGIPLTTTSTALAEDVADLAIALAVMARRRLVAADAHARGGAWRQGAFPLGRSLSRCRLGLLGYGHIGQAVARRAAGMGMPIAYCTRRRREDSPHAYRATPLELAQGCDLLVVACPGGEANRHLVTGAVLDSLGPEGTLVNVARGEIVDQDALIVRLADGRLGSAGLDVLEGEPVVPEALARLENVVLLPHLGSATVEARHAMGQAMIEGLVKHL